MTNQPPAEKRWFGSELIAWAFQLVGTETQQVKPTDILNSKLVKPASIKKDTTDDQE